MIYRVAAVVTELGDEPGVDGGNQRRVVRSFILFWSVLLLGAVAISR